MIVAVAVALGIEEVSKTQRIYRDRPELSSSPGSSRIKKIRQTRSLIDPFEASLPYLERRTIEKLIPQFRLSRNEGQLIAHYLEDRGDL